MDNCKKTGPVNESNLDKPPQYCGDRDFSCDDLDLSLLDVPGVSGSWLDQPTFQHTGNGTRADCDPFLKGHIVNGQDGKATDRNVVYRYAKSLRGTHEAIQTMFNDIIVLDINGKAHTVPIIWGTQEKAVIALLGENYRDDPTMVVDRIKLPMMSIAATSYDIDMKRYTYHKAVDYLRTHKNNWKPGFTIKEKWERDTVFGVSRGLPINIGYTLNVWTMFEEDIIQITEQIWPKIVPMGYIRVRGIDWEIPVRLDSQANNIDYEPGDQADRVIKFQFNLTAESYIAQPIHRKKSVLSTKVEITDRINDDDIAEVIARLEESVEEM